MSFTSLNFLLFVLAASIVYYIIPRRCRWLVLLVFSYAFYLTAGLKPVFFLLISTFVSYGVGLWVQKAGEHREDKALKKRDKRLVLCLGLVLNFGMLALVKYTDFAIENINAIFHAGLGFKNLALPLGISFYTFQTTGYLIDCYRGKYRAERNPAKYALFVSFFPQLLQGPIGRYDRLANQLFEPHEFDLTRVQHGVQRIFWGYFKKMVLADRAAVVVNEVFLNYPNHDGTAVLLGVLMYSIQLYADFSGGMDVVLGVAEIFGITLDENFKRPYFAISITDFWHRWHITLGTWMKDYLFYPMSLSKGMNRLGKKAGKYFGKTTGRMIPIALVNIIVFLVVGIWHGPAWKYIVYGLYNGILIALANLLAPVNKKALRLCHINGDSKGWQIFRILRTFFLVNVSWFFDISLSLTAGLGMMRTLVTDFRWASFTDGSIMNLGLDRLDFLILGLGCILLFIVSLMQERGTDIREFIDRRHVIIRWGIYLFLIFSLPVFGNLVSGAGGFIYAQF